MEEKLSMLSELIRLMRFDQDEQETEFNFILSIAESMGVSSEQCAKLFNEYADYVAPKYETERIIQFQRLILLANLDVEVSPREINFLQKAGMKLGLNPDAIQAVLNKMKEFPAGNIPPADLMEIYKVYHN